jgi:TusA-related sulfurtransferase
MEVVSTVIDCRNQICPKPIIMIKRALAEADLGKTLEIVVNDHSSKTNVLKYCWNHGQEIHRSFGDGNDFHIFVTKSQDKKVESPVPVIGPCGARWD